MTANFDWYNPADPIAVTTRDLIAYGTALVNFGAHRGLGLVDYDERAAALRQVGYIARHRGEA
jgi:hypothetical protein